ncbi:MAG: toll/interleukin-1 receptor domain-containing protein [Verrucomicrobiales bacterium]
MRLFISYSHLDKDWMGWLRPLLDGFKYDARITTLGGGLNVAHAWHDGELPQGNPWDSEIKSELERMDVFVPLVSHNFFSSWYIQTVELPSAIKSNKTRKVKIVPVILHEVNLREKCPFLHQFPLLPPDKAWSIYPDKRDAHSIIDEGLWNVIKAVISLK